MWARVHLPYRSPDGATRFTADCPIALVEHDLLDARTLEREGKMSFELDTAGFTLVQAESSQVRDMFDDQQVVSIGFPEVENIIRRNISGVTSVYCFDHAIRTGGSQLKDSPEGTQHYGSLVHCDCTVRSGWTRARDQALGSDEVLLKYNRWPASFEGFNKDATRPPLDALFRAETVDHNSPNGYGSEFMIVNVWRPLDDVVLQYPLALCDARSFEQGDVHPSWLRHFGVTSNDGSSIDGSHVAAEEEFRTGEVLTPLHNAGHRWVFYPHMTNREALLLKTFDSRKDSPSISRFHCHSAVMDPRGDPKAHRRSVEYRCVVFLGEKEQTHGAGSGTSKL